jgi:hypothetical protein
MLAAYSSAIIFPGFEFMKTQKQLVAEHIARAIVTGTRKKYSSLYADALGEIMSTPVSSNSMNAEGSPSLNQGSNPPRANEARGLAFKVPAQVTSSDKLTDQMTNGSQVNVGNIKPVDRRTVTGSYNGKTVGYDAVGDVVKLPANPGPREARGQSQVMSSRLQEAPGPQVTVSGDTLPSSEVE